MGSLQTCHCSLLMYLNAQSHLHRQTEHLVRPNVAFVPFPCWRQDVNHPPPPPPPFLVPAVAASSELFIRTVNGLTCINTTFTVTPLFLLSHPCTLLNMGILGNFQLSDKLFWSLENYFVFIIKWIETLHKIDFCNLGLVCNLKKIYLYTYFMRLTLQSQNNY